LQEIWQSGNRIAAHSKYGKTVAIYTETLPIFVFNNAVVPHAKSVEFQHKQI
jgi:hypothetical protein